MAKFLIAVAPTLLACFLMIAASMTVAESDKATTKPPLTKHTLKPIKTTAATNTTTAARNITTPARNMTTAEGNLTTLPTDMTTAATDMTTSMSSRTTPRTTITPTPTPSSLARWQVHGKDGKLCMLMDFNGTLTYFKTPMDPLKVTIPKETDIKKSVCNSENANFILDFIAADGIWELMLHFTTSGNSSYKLQSVATNLYTMQGVRVAGNESMETFFKLPLGNYYSCDEFNEVVGDFNVNLTTPIFQPFVQKTSHGGLGNVTLCKPATTPASNKTTQVMTTKVTPKPLAKWVVRDKNGKVCMLMDFIGLFSYHTAKRQVASLIPPEANIAASTCTSKDAKFVLEFNGGPYIDWTLDLDFTNTGNQYDLGYVSVKLNVSGDDPMKSSEHLKQTILTAPVGKYYNCDELDIKMDNFTINLYYTIFQPFAQQTSGTLGKSFECGIHSSPNVGLIVGVTVAVVTVVGVLGITFYYMRKRRIEKNKYTSMNN